MLPSRLTSLIPAFLTTLGCSFWPQLLFVFDRIFTTPRENSRHYVLGPHQGIFFKAQQSVTVKLTIKILKKHTKQFNIFIDDFQIPEQTSIHDDFENHFIHSFLMLKFSYNIAYIKLILSTPIAQATARRLKERS